MVPFLCRDSFRNNEVGMGTMTIVLGILSAMTYVGYQSLAALMVLLSFYVAAFAIGLGPVGFVLFSEVCFSPMDCVFLFRSYSL